MVSLGIVNYNLSIIVRYEYTASACVELFCGTVCEPIDQ